MKRHPSFLLAGITFLTFAGCANYSGIEPRAQALPDNRLVATAAAGTAEAAGTPFANWPKRDWWQDLQDPTLNRLVERALADNPALQVAAARLRRARAAAGLAESALWPQLALTSTNTREHFSENGLTPSPYAGTTRDINDLQLAGQWELDFFGKNQASLQAALGEARASAVDRQAARQLLATNIVRGYYNLARLLAQHRLSEARQQTRIELAQLVERRFQAGIDTRVELESAAGVIPENARDIAALDEQIAIARHALAALLGGLPGEADAIAPELPASLPLALPASLPAELLGHRADVVAARWRVEAATQARLSTQALFYPNINLRGFTGFLSIGLDQWLTASNLQSGLGLAISLPIFDAGRLRALYGQSTAGLDEAVATYNQTLLAALRETADELSTQQALDQRLAHQRAVLASVERSHELALQRYRADISDRLNVLNTETALINQRRIGIDLLAGRIDSQLRLAHALGGGFADQTPATPPPTSAATTTPDISTATLARNTAASGSKEHDHAN